jgi:hypothetical protein
MKRREGGRESGKQRCVEKKRQRRRDEKRVPDESWGGDRKASPGSGRSRASEVRARME